MAPNGSAAIASANAKRVVHRRVTQWVNGVISASCTCEVLSNGCRCRGATYGRDAESGEDES